MGLGDIATTRVFLKKFLKKTFLIFAEQMAGVSVVADNEACTNDTSAAAIEGSFYKKCGTMQNLFQMLKDHKEKKPDGHAYDLAAA